MSTAIQAAKDQQTEVKEVSAPYPGIVSTVDGSAAVVWVEAQIAQGACAYPITPSTPMGDGFAVEYANGKKNLWGEPLVFLEPESEHSSASACEGFALAGGRVTNFTSGQGLILMKEVLYVISGKRLPVVFHIGARALTSHSLNVHAGHDDVMGVTDVGWGIVFGRNAQEAADLALIARRAAEDSETPFMNVQDGFLTTHTLETVRLPEPEMMKDFVGAPADRLRSMFDPKNPILSGCVQNQDSYMKGKVAQRCFYERVAPALKSAMARYGELTGRKYDFIRGYRMEDAEYALLGMGSMMDTAEATVDYLRKQGMKIGAVTITSFRPFPGAELAHMLRNCKAVSVIERCDTPLSESNPLTTEVKAALADAQMTSSAVKLAHIPEVFGGVAGLGGRDLRPGHFVAAAANMMTLNPRKNFVLGVKHVDSLEMVDDPDVRPAGAFSMRGHSIGGFGSVTTNKVIASVASDLFNLYAQAFPKYGSEKKGLPTNYYLTLAPETIRLHCELNIVDFVAIQDQNAFLSGDPLVGLHPGGIVYWQSQLPAEKVWASLPVAARNRIREGKLRLFTLDALKIAKESSSRVDLQIRMQGIVLLGAFLKLTPFRERLGLNEEQLFGSLEKTLTKYFGKRGGRVVEDNMNAAKRGFHEVTEIKAVPEVQSSAAKKNGNDWVAFSTAGGDLVPVDFCDRIITGYARGKEAELEADEYIARSLMPASSGTRRSFRTLGPDIPVFDAAKCVGCMECVNVCPDTAILAKVAEIPVIDEKLSHIERPELRAAVKARFAKTTKYHDLPVKKGETGGLFGIFVDADKCKGCGECVTACGTHDALKMVAKATNGSGGADLKEFDVSMDLYRHLPDTPKKFINEKALGDMMLATDSHLFVGGAGSCMGCGEATSVRLMLAATGFLYGPEKIGIVGATGCNSVFGSTYPFTPYAVPWTNSLFENAPADAMGIRVRWNQQGHDDYRLWVLGGDGAMYDIGFQSLSRMMMSGLDIKVLVLDTQVYSNTGGQTSTATFMGQDAKMAQYGKAQPGKREMRKEIAQIMMAHPNVFVAQVTMAHLNHFYKAVMDANAFPGPAVIIAYAACQPEHGIPDDASIEHARMAVESRAFPLLTYDPRRGESIKQRLSLVGNPSVKDDWMKDKTGSAVDFITFARAEGRFARHFDKDGNADEFIKQAQGDRLLNWRHLQEMAGVK